MSVFMIGYDLNSPKQDYKALYKEIKSFGTYWHHLDSTWLVESKLSAGAIRDKISKKIDGNDSLFVAKLSGEAAWRGINSSGSEWLQNQL